MRCVFLFCVAFTDYYLFMNIYFLAINKKIVYFPFSSAISKNIVDIEIKFLLV